MSFNVDLESKATFALALTFVQIALFVTLLYNTLTGGGDIDFPNTVRYSLFVVLPFFMAVTTMLSVRYLCEMALIMYAEVKKLNLDTKVPCDA